MNLKRIMRMIGRWCAKNATKLLAGGAIFAEITGFWLMHKEAPIVRERLDALGKDAKWTEKLKTAAPVYLPAFGMLLLSCGCTVGGCIAGDRQVAIATSLYSASEAALRKIEDSMVKELGPEQAQKVHDAVAKEIIESDPIEKKVIYETGNGSDIIYDPLSGRYFRSSPTAIIAAVGRINKRITSELEMWASVNDFYDEIGLEPIGLGGRYGWNMDHQMEICDEPKSWTTVSTEDGHAAFVITYYQRPVLYK